MNTPQVNLTITIRPIEAGSYEEAVEIAYNSINFYFRSRLGIESLAKYREAVRCYKEPDDTFTVVLP